MQHLWLRLTIATIATACALIVWQIVSLMIANGNATPLMIAATSLVGLTGVFAAGLTFAPHSRLLRLIEWLSRVMASIRANELPKDSRAGWLLIGLGVLTFVTLVGRMLSLPNEPQDDDQGAFLQMAITVSESGGPLQLVQDLYGGRFSESNRHPLYIALLSLRPTPEFGHGLSTILGLGTLLLLTWMTARRQGVLVAGVVCVLLATNMAFCLFSTRFVCDVLMILWGGLLYQLAMKTNSTSQPRDALLIGAVLGLAYLTKGTGLLMFVGMVGWTGLLCLRRKTSLKDAAISMLLILTAWIIVASPLLVRNIRRHGTPLYNTNTWLLFVDKFEPSVELSQRLTVGEAARGYWESHTLVDIAQREASGLAWETFILLRMLGPAPLDDSRALTGLLLVLSAVLGIVADPRREHALLGLWGLLLVGMFAWYVPIAAGDRFLFPLLAPLLLCASEGIVRLVSLRTNDRVSTGPRLLVILAAVYCGLVILASCSTNWLVDLL